MTQEEKDLLLKDLSTRLPYGVKGIITYNGDKDIFTVKDISNVLFLSDAECCHVDDFKPYLRPMSSMTEEDKKYLMSLKYQPSALKWKNLIISSQEIIDWLNRKMFDYRDLIPLGLALEAPEGMYNVNEK